MIFKNRNIGKEITVDLDNFFFYFIRPQAEVPDGEKQGITLQAIRERLIRLDPSLTIGMTATYRRSSKDHVHVKLRFSTELAVLDGFMIRAFMLDDQTRLELDLARYLLTDDLHEMNRCFDEKAEVGITRKAGSWIPISCDRDHLPKDAFDDFMEYLPRWERFKKAHPKIFKTACEQQLELDFC